MNFRTLLSHLAILSFSLHSACGAISSKNSDSKLKHDVGGVVRSDNPYQWDVSSVEEFRAFEKGSGAHPLFQTPKYDEISPLTIRVQQWIDRIDAAIRKVDPVGTQNVPRPLANILSHQGLNAYASAIAICKDFPFVYKAEGITVPDSGVTYYLNQDGRFWRKNASSIECVKRNLDPKERLAFAGFLWRNFPDCKLSDNGKEIVGTGQCGFETSVRLNSVHYFATSNIITVYNNLITPVDKQLSEALNPDGTRTLYYFPTKEDEFVAMLVHELGHYYLAHPIAAFTDYNYSFFNEDVNPKQKPKRDPEVEAFLARMSWAGSRATEEPLEHFQGKWTRVTLKNFAKRDPDDYCSDDAPNCRQLCKAFGSAIAEASGKNDWWNDKKVDDTLKPCLETVKESGVEDMMEDLLDDNYWAIEPSLEETWTTAPDAFTAFASYNEYVKSETIKGTIEYRALQKEALERRLSDYTIEYEADQFASEWLARMGFPAATQENSILSLFYIISRKTAARPWETNYHDCRKMADKGWKDDAGQEVFVPFAREEGYPSMCYRAFDVHREYIAHDYENLPKIPGIAPLSPSWDELVTRTRNETREAWLKLLALPKPTTPPGNFDLGPL